MAKQNMKQLREITERLEKGIKELFTSERYLEYLRTMSQFHNYSFNNTLLIALQRPDATLVAGYQTWKNKFERHVKKGEKGIQIFAPIKVKETKEIEKMDPVTNEPVLNADGQPEVEKVEVNVQRFRVTTVFDVSQTDGKPLPEIMVEELSGNVKEYEIFMKAIKAVSPVPIRFDEIEGGAKGFYHNVDKEIVIQSSMSESQTMKTAIHEVTHAILHDRDFLEEKGEKKDRMTKEVEAESVAYTVCQYFGLDTSEYSFPYIAGWSSGRELEELMASMELIRKTAGEFIDAMVEKIKTLQEEKQRYSEKAMENEVLEKPGSFIHHYYVVEDLKKKGSLDIQEYTDLEEALQVYFSLPNDKWKVLGVQNNLPLPGSLDFIQCKNGVDTLIKDYEISNGWNNPEIKNVVKMVEEALETHDIQIAYQVGEWYLLVQSTEEGYDYTMYDGTYRELDGGVYDNPFASVSHTVEEILGDQVMGFADCKVISYEELMEQVQIRNRITPEQAKCLEEGRPSILERIERRKQEVPEGKEIEGRKKRNMKNKDAVLE